MSLKFRISHEAQNKFVTYRSYFWGLPLTWHRFKSYAQSRSRRALLPHERDTRYGFYTLVDFNDYTDTFYDEDAARASIENERARIRAENERYERIREEKKAFKPNKTIVY